MGTGPRRPGPPLFGDNDGGLLGIDKGADIGAGGGAGAGGIAFDCDAVVLGSGGMGGMLNFELGPA